MENNRGYEIEVAMKKWFKGENHEKDCVDFQTKKCLYEVKSCKLFNKCKNNNDKRPYAKKKHKRIKTAQLGRFFIIINNHKKLKKQAAKEKKIAKYIFVIIIGKQKVWRIKSWKEVNKLIKTKKEYCYIILKDILYETWGDKR